MDNELAKTTDQGLSLASQYAMILPRMEEFQKRLSVAPPEKEIATNNGVKYLPISFVENKLREYYAGGVQFEVLKSYIATNEFVVEARIKVLHPVLGVWLNYDGIGASQIQQRSGTKLTDFVENKIANALEKNAPKAYAMAIKNGAAKIGKAFGSDMNRKLEDDYDSIYTGEMEWNTAKPLLEAQLASCTTKAMVIELFNSDATYATNPEAKAMFRIRTNELSA